MVNERHSMLILGARGFLGSNLLRESARVFDVTGHVRTMPAATDAPRGLAPHHLVSDDLDGPASIERFLEAIGPDVVVNCAAVANVDACERDRDLAHRVNDELVGWLADACRRLGSRLVHVSTDAVFGGRAGPYDEDSAVCPLNEYGRSKVGGEERATAAGALVLRTNLVGWSAVGDRSLLEFFVDRLRRLERTPAFDDVRFRPVTPAQFFEVLVELLEREVSGIVHLTGAELISKFDFAHMVAREFGLSADLIDRRSVVDAGLTAPRANTLDVVPRRLSQLGITLPDLATGLVDLREREEHGYRHDLAVVRASRGELV
jgi:dTDP-4-dehydrorhamnose reductase